MGDLDALNAALNSKDDFVFKSDEDPIPRDRWGRPLIVPPDGGKPVAYTRCTTHAGTIDDTYNLTQWKLRTSAVGLSRRPDLQLAVSANADDKYALNKICEQALQAGGSDTAANTGSALHKLSEFVDRGDYDVLQTVPEVYKRDLRAYMKAVAKLTTLEIERFVVQDDLRIGGTFDRLVEYQGESFIADIKTGSVDFGAGKIAQQLGTYANSVYYYHPTKESPEPRREPLPENLNRDRGIVIHLPAGTGECELLWIDLAKGWHAVRELSAPVREFRKNQKHLLTPFN